MIWANEVGTNYSRLRQFPHLCHKNKHIQPLQTDLDKDAWLQPNWRITVFAHPAMTVWIYNHWTLQCDFCTVPLFLWHLSWSHALAMLEEHRLPPCSLRAYSLTPQGSCPHVFPGKPAIGPWQYWIWILSWWVGWVVAIIWRTRWICNSTLKYKL